MIRLLLSFILFIFSFSYAELVCKEVIDQEATDKSKPTEFIGGSYEGTYWHYNCPSYQGSYCNGDGASNYVARDGYWTWDLQTWRYDSSVSSWVYKSSDIKKVKKIDIVYKQECEDVPLEVELWESCEVGKTKKDWIKSMTFTVGDTSSTIANKMTTYKCSSPPIDFTLEHSSDSTPNDFDSEVTCTGSACNDKNLLEKPLDNVPCFGGNCIPDLSKDEKYQGLFNGVPCFASSREACEQWQPDYVNNAGVPCYGDFCTSDGKAPIYTNQDGSKCVGSYCDGANGTLSNGQSISNGSHGGTGTGGGGSGSGSVGDSPFDFEFDFPECTSADCNASTVGKGAALNVDKDSIYESKYGGSTLFNHISNNPINIENTSLGRMINSFVPVLPQSSCPVWTLPNIFGGDVIDVSPPCWIFDLIKTLVLISSLIYARKIVLGA